MSASFSVRLTDDLATALEQCAAQLGSTPTDILRAALLHYLAQSTNHPSAQDESVVLRQICFEAAKTRSVIMRYLDQKIGTTAADKLLDEAELDAQAYVEQQRKGG